MATEQIKTRKRSTALIAFSLVIVVLIGMIVGLAEFILQQLGLGDPLIYEHNPAYGYALAPNQKKERLRGRVVQINSRGLRSEAWPEHDERTKIVFLGDSVTYGGSYVGNQETFAAEVCNLMGEQFLCGNAGVNGYGVLNMVLRSRFDVRLEDADIVVFTVIKKDFLRGINNSDSAHFYLAPSRTWLPAIEEAINFMAALYPIKNYLSKRNTPPRDPAFIAKSRLGAAEFAAESLASEVDRLSAQGKPVYVFYSPTREEARASSARDEMFEILLAVLPGLIDLTPHFSESYADDFYDQWHYEVAGHLTAARAMASKIARASE